MLNKKGISFCEEEKLNFSRSWQISRENSNKMIEYILTLAPLDTEEIIQLNTLQSFNQEWSRMAADLVKSLINKKDALMKEKENILTVEENAKKCDQIDRWLQEVLEQCSLISKFMRCQSLSVYNDSFEAYLEEMLRESYARLMYSSGEGERVCEFFKNALTYFQTCKQSTQNDHLYQNQNFEKELLNNLRTIKNAFENLF